MYACFIKSRQLLFVLIVVLYFIIASMAHAQTTVIYQDDFEGSVTGWSDNKTDFDPDVTRFLGRFADGQTTTSRSFTLPQNSDELIIAFDLYRFDSWDNFAQFGFDRFELEINGAEVFSLPFPNPQAARSGITNNIEWSHRPLTGREELAFAAGQFFFDQLHRFEIRVPNPDTIVELTLRADLSQPDFDESAGYDNFLVTVEGDTNFIQAVAEDFDPINGDIGGVTPSVLTSDTINGVVLDPNDVTIDNILSSSLNVSLNPSTGVISVAPNTAPAIYTLDYQICENINPTNCSSVTETVTVFIPGGEGLICPAGFTAIPGNFNVVAASVSPNTGGQPNNLNGALGTPLPEGTVVTNDNQSGTTFFQSLIYDLTGDPEISVPEGAVIEVSLANHFNSNPTANIAASLDGATFTPIGSSNGPWVNNTFRYDEFVVPAGGARFLEIQYGGGGGLRFDGVIYNTQCQIAPDDTNITARKTVNVFDPQNLGLYALPGNDVIYTISIENSGAGIVDAGSLILIDRLPSEVIFFNDDIDDAGPETDPVSFQTAGSGLTFNYATSVGFSDASSPPEGFEDCSYVPAPGYDANISFICINPTGSMSGNSAWSIRFRARIS